MFKRGLWVLILQLIAFNAVAAVPLQTDCTTSACVVYNQAVVYADVSMPLQFKWDEVVGNRYALEIVKFPVVSTDKPAFIYQIPIGTTSFSTKLDKAGVYYARIRACFGATCTPYKFSYEPADTGPKYPRGFIIVIGLKYHL